MEKNTHKPFQQFDSISFYVIAHADDWHLFMHPNVYNDIVSPGCKVIFIVTTAGDSGFGENFWLAREEGLKSTVRFCLAPFNDVSESGGQRKINNYTVHYWSANSTTAYFLRLPDGSLDGNGFEATGFQSLSKFKSGQTDALESVDHATSYENWSALLNTLESIISFESHGISNKWVHYLNPGMAINPTDHPDHTATGLAIQSISTISTFYQSLYMGYNAGAARKNLSLKDAFWKAGMFAAYEKAVYDRSGYSTLREDPDIYINWCNSTVDPIIAAPLPASLEGK